MMKGEIKPVVYAPTRKHGIREGRGFSLEEIQRAGLTLHGAKMLEIPIDNRRKTAHIKNVETLKEHFSMSIRLTEIRGIGKATEKQLMSEGIMDVCDLAHADINALAEKAPHSKRMLKRWQCEAEKLLGKD